jgi:hypothetical protein
MLCSRVSWQSIMNALGWFFKKVLRIVHRILTYLRSWLNIWSHWITYLNNNRMWINRYWSWIWLAIVCRMIRIIQLRLNRIDVNRRYLVRVGLANVKDWSILECMKGVLMCLLLMIRLILTSWRIILSWRILMIRTGLEKRVLLLVSVGWVIS